MGQTPVVILNGYKAVKEGIITHSEETSGRPLTPFYRDMMGEKGRRCYRTEIWTRQRRKMPSYETQPTVIQTHNWAYVA